MTTKKKKDCELYTVDLEAIGMKDFYGIGVFPEEGQPMMVDINKTMQVLADHYGKADCVVMALRDIAAGDGSADGYKAEIMTIHLVALIRYSGLLDLHSATVDEAGLGGPEDRSAAGQRVDATHAVIEALVGAVVVMKMYLVNSGIPLEKLDEMEPYEPVAT